MKTLLILWALATVMASCSKDQQQTQNEVLNIPFVAQVRHDLDSSNEAHDKATSIIMDRLNARHIADSVRMYEMEKEYRTNFYYLSRDFEDLSKKIKADSARNGKRTVGQDIAVGLLKIARALVF